MQTIFCHIEYFLTLSCHLCPKPQRQLTILLSPFNLHIFAQNIFLIKIIFAPYFHLSKSNCLQSLLKSHVLCEIFPDSTSGKQSFFLLSHHNWTLGIHLPQIFLCLFLKLSKKSWSFKSHLYSSLSTLPEILVTQLYL